MRRATITNYQILPTTQEHIEELSLTMRDDDIAEMKALSNMSPLEAIQHLFDKSIECRTGLADDKVMCVFGINGISLVSDAGMPFMLSSTELGPHWRIFARGSKEVVSDWLSRYTPLVSCVDIRYTKSIRWLKWVGFKIHSTVKLGVDGQEFHIIKKV